jgi:hypothetical protein
LKTPETIATPEFRVQDGPFWVSKHERITVHPLWLKPPVSRQTRFHRQGEDLLRGVQIAHPDLSTLIQKGDPKSGFPQARSIVGLPEAGLAVENRQRRYHAG